MGYQLWTSPITGYRRKGTRLSELRAVLSAGISARTILEPIQCCPIDAPAPEMREVLARRGFDVAGVMKDQEEPVVGFVIANELLDRTIESHTKPLNAEYLISEATPIGDLLKVLHTRERVFVLVGPEVKGIVTLADLNKPPIRVYLFGLVSLLEMHLQFWVRNVYGEDSWKKGLKSERLDAANKLLEVRRRRNEQIGLLDCLQLCDKRELILANDELRKKLGIESKTKGEKLFGRAEKLRDKLAHSQQELVEGTSWQELIELIENMEVLVQRSDDAVELAAKPSKGTGPSLWVAT